MKANQTLHGLEYELQLMLETEKGLEIVNAEAVLKGKQRIFPKNVGLDMGNIEIRTKPQSTYEKAAKEANQILYNKLVPCLIKQHKKFALFLPNPMCGIYFRKEDKSISYGSPIPICMKHWNISFPFKIPKKEFQKSKDHFRNLDFLQVLTLKNIHRWKYDYKALVSKGYDVLFKDCFPNYYAPRIHVALPYHHSPPQGNPDNLPVLEEILVPDSKWRNILCYYRHGFFIKMRDLV